MDNDLPLAEQPVSPAPAQPALAGFWTRGGAVLLDTLILALCSLVPVQGLGILVGLAYKTIFLSQGGQTPGKMAAGIKVVTLTGEPVSIGRALCRALAEHLNILTLGLGYLIAGFSDKRALHDYVCGTRVVYVEGVGSGRKVAFSALGGMAFFLPLVILFIAASTLGLGSFSKFKTLAQNSNEATTKGNLGSLRSALSIYYGDAEGNYPATLEALIPKHLTEIPKTKLAAHMETNIWTPYGAEVCTGKTEYGSEIDAGKLRDTGGWGYVTDPKAKCAGMIFVDCTHQDTKGKRWPEY